MELPQLQKPPQHPDLPELQASFPRLKKYRSVWKSQEEMLRFIAEHGSSVIEAPTGSGKTAVEYAVLKAAQSQGLSPLFLVTPTKTLVEQIKGEFPDLKVALGRNEHPCLHYEDEEELTAERLLELPSDPENLRADKIPCSMLGDCPHRVDQESGETMEPGAIPCPYLQQKFLAKQGGIVLCTDAFWLFSHLFSREFETAGALVIDEAHRLAEVIRRSLSYEITDYHLHRSADLLQKIGAVEAEVILQFVGRMTQVIKKRAPRRPTLLEAHELRELMDILEEIDSREVEKKIRQAVKEKRIDVVAERATLRQLEVLTRDLRRYLRSFEFSLPAADRAALNYTYAFWQKEKGEGEKVQHRLVVKNYYVVPLVKKLLSPLTVAFSATIGDPEVFGYESGIRFPALSLESDFPAANARIFMPTDTPNLAVNARQKRDVTRSLRLVARTAKKFAKAGHRSLVVVISNAERDKFRLLAEEEGLEAMSYGNGQTPKEAALRFKQGEGEALIGTAANYAEGVDLPAGIAPVIFFLRPGYPPPQDPGTIFEERRFGAARWAVWNWRVMLQALQVRGRNIRGKSDLGVTFFISQQFRRFLFASLPKWLEKAYRGERTFDECVKEAEGLLG